MDTSLPAIEARLVAFREHCACLGLALTPQRLAVYRILASTGDHPAAETIFQQLKPTMSSLSRGTVYRILSLFERHGLVSRVPINDEQARYDANLDDHHHLVCVRCQAVQDLQHPLLEQLTFGELVPAGFQVLHHRIHLFGLCQQCQSPAAAPESS